MPSNISLVVVWSLSVTLATLLVLGLWAWRRRTRTGKVSQAKESVPITKTQRRSVNELTAKRKKSSAKKKSRKPAGSSVPRSNARKTVDVAVAKVQGKAYPALDNAIEKSDVSEVRSLLRAGADPNGVADDGMTPLLRAMEYYRTSPTNQVRIIIDLLHNGADVNGSGKVGLRPLHIAVTRDDGPLVFLLISKGADVNAETDGGDTPLDRAAGMGDARLEVARMLLHNGANLEGGRGRKILNRIKDPVYCDNERIISLIENNL